MGISIISYSGEVTLGLMVDEKLVKEPQVIMERFAQQFELLAERAGAISVASQTAIDADGNGAGGVEETRTKTAKV
jgi:hypothetical protein